MIRSSQAVVEDLLRFGADFQKDEKGELVFTREGAHSEKRIIFHEDVTGKEITSTLLAQVKAAQYCLPWNIQLWWIRLRNNVCYGAVVQKPDGN